MFKDALGKALQGAKDLEAREPTPEEQAAEQGPQLPDPHDSDWVRMLSEYEAIPAKSSLGRLESLTGTRAKALKRSGQGKQAKQLTALRDQFLRAREKAAWSLAKARWTELGLSDKAWRRAKQEKLDAEKVLAKLGTRAARDHVGRTPAVVIAWLKQ